MTSYAEQFAVLFRAEVAKAMDHLREAFRDELKAQGHYNIGKLSDSIHYEIELISTSIIATMFIEEYGFPVDTGVAAANIPYNRGSGAQSSKYIDGLVAYFKSKGLGEVEGRRAAFATANKHKQEGMPTRGSFAYSNNGRRTGFNQATIAENSEKILGLMGDNIGESIGFIFRDFINKMAYEAQRG